MTVHPLTRPPPAGATSTTSSNTTHPHPNTTETTMTDTTTDLTACAADFEAVLTKHFAGQDQPGIRETVETFLASLPPTQAPAAAELRQHLDVALAAIERVREQAQYLKQDPGSADAMAAMAGRTHDAEVYAALDRVAAGFDESDLLAAQEDVQRLTQALTRAQVDLDAALSSGDFDQLVLLRRRVELDLPGELAEAEAELLALQAEAAEAGAAVTRERNRPAVEYRAELVRREKETRHQADVLLKELRELDRTAGDDAVRRDSLASKRAREARRAADAAAARLEGDRVARVRRLAGLV